MNQNKIHCLNHIHLGCYCVSVYQYRDTGIHSLLVFIFPLVPMGVLAPCLHRLDAVAHPPHWLERKFLHRVEVSIFYLRSHFSWLDSMTRSQVVYLRELTIRPYLRQNVWKLHSDWSVWLGLRVSTAGLGKSGLVQYTCLTVQVYRDWAAVQLYSNIIGPSKVCMPVATYLDSK